MSNLIPVSFQVGQQAILSYARIAKDFNPIHTDADYAVKAGFAGVIAHGTIALNLIWRSLELSLGETAGPITVDIRFKAPVNEHDWVEAGGERVSDSTYSVWVQNQRGERVIEGIARIG
jgi:acyl dehydratase